MNCQYGDVLHCTKGKSGSYKNHTTTKTAQSKAVETNTEGHSGRELEYQYDSDIEVTSESEGECDEIEDVIITF